MVACRGVVLYHPPTLWASITVISLAPLPRKTRAFLHPFVPCSVGQCRSFARSFFRLFIRSFRFAHSLFCSIKISSFVCLLVRSFILYCSSARPLSHYPFVRSFTIFSPLSLGNWNDGRFEDDGQLVTPNYSYFGTFNGEQPVGPGRFLFDTGCEQEGEYVTKRTVRCTNAMREVVHVPVWRCLALYDVGRRV